MVAALGNSGWQSPRTMSELPVGEPVAFTPPPLPSGRELAGRYVTLRPLVPAADAEPLYAITHPPAGDGGVWRYLSEGPFESVQRLQETMEAWAADPARRFYAVTPEGARTPLGVLAYLRMEPAHGSIEIGHILFARGLRRTRAATETIFLLALEAFEALGYRRLEWKCNALNAGSRRAAERFGFAFEGVFAQHMVVKGRNRDTAWYAITDRRWPGVRAGFEAWLDPANFDAAGGQRRSLSQCHRDS
jgi:RimJ/RimL family protein N-acetyltransferase